jgi:dTDP-glucose pyrophosphorylase
MIDIDINQVFLPKDLKIALVTSDTKQLLGSVSDGDIRRGLLKGLTINSSLDNVINRNTFVVPPQLEREQVMKLMLANKIQQIPVVDEWHCVVGLHLWDEIIKPTARPNLIIIMAGGIGMRMRPHTENCPKPLLKVAGKPILEHIIERAKADGFNKFILVIHYLGHMIQDYFGDGARFGVHIEYLREEEPLGTAGGLGFLNPLPDIPFVVCNGDVISGIHLGEFLDFHAEHGAAATMAVRSHEWQHPFGVVQIEGLEIVGFEEKPISRTHINAGVYALDPASLEVLNPGMHCDMPTLFKCLHNRALKTIAYPMHEMWMDVGRPDDLRQMNAEI